MQQSEAVLNLMDLHGLSDHTKVHIITSGPIFDGEVVYTTTMNDLLYSVTLRLPPPTTASGELVTIFVNAIVAVIR